MAFTKELLEKAKAAKSAEELAELAKKNGVELTADEAKKNFDKLNAEGEISDAELDNVAGGCFFDDDADYTVMYCKACGWTTTWGGTHYVKESPYRGPCGRCGAANIFVKEYHED